MKVPKGTSDYQAAWIVDTDENCNLDEESSEDDDCDDEMMDEIPEGNDDDSQVIVPFVYLEHFHKMFYF